MTGLNINRAEFIRSAASAQQFIRTPQPVIAFAGKSNVGKSSVINCMLNRRNFARVGGQPGKTVHVNYFQVDGKLYLVDLPGYGYAKVSREEKERWGQLMESFFSTGDCFSLGVLIVDARHAPTADDVTMADWFLHSEKPFFVIANKLDKLRKTEWETNLPLIRKTLSLNDSISVLPFSAEKGTGRENLWNQIFSALSSHL